MWVSNSYVTPASLEARGIRKDGGHDATSAALGLRRRAGARPPLHARQRAHLPGLGAHRAGDARRRRRPARARACPTPTWVRNVLAIALVLLGGLVTALRDGPLGAGRAGDAHAHSRCRRSTSASCSPAPCSSERSCSPSRSQRDGARLDAVRARPGRRLAAAAGLCWLPFAGRRLSPDEGGLLLLAGQWSPGSSLYGDYFVDRPPGLIALAALADAAGGGWALPRRSASSRSSSRCCSAASSAGSRRPTGPSAPVLTAATAALLDRDAALRRHGRQRRGAGPALPARRDRRRAVRRPVRVGTRAPCGGACSPAPRAPAGHW